MSQIKTKLKEIHKHDIQFSNKVFIQIDDDNRGSNAIFSNYDNIHKCIHYVMGLFDGTSFGSGKKRLNIETAEITIKDL